MCSNSYTMYKFIHLWYNTNCHLTHNFIMTIQIYPISRKKSPQKNFNRWSFKTWALATNQWFNADCSSAAATRQQSQVWVFLLHLLPWTLPACLHPLPSPAPGSFLTLLNTSITTRWLGMKLWWNNQNIPHDLNFYTISTRSSLLPLIVVIKTLKWPLQE